MFDSGPKDSKNQFLKSFFNSNLLRYNFEFTMLIDIGMKTDYYEF